MLVFYLYLSICIDYFLKEKDSILILFILYGIYLIKSRVVMGKLKVGLKNLVIFYVLC